MSKDVIKDLGENIVKPVTDTIDDVHTSREESENIRTERLAYDMQSDNFLAKAVRPFILIYLVFLFTGLSLVDMLTELEISPSFLSIIERWGDLVFMFYFTSRGVEKVAKIANRQIIKLRKQDRKDKRTGWGWFKK